MSSISSFVAIPEGYTLHAVIRNSLYGCVVSAFHNETKEQVCIKIFNTGTMAYRCDHVFDKYDVEVAAMKAVKGKDHLVQLKDVIETKSFNYIVMEYAPMKDLCDFDATDYKFSEAEVKVILKQLVLGCKTFNDMGYVNGDISPENIGLFKAGSTDKPGDWVAKQLDFGSIIPAVMTEEEFNKQNFTQILLGKLGYSAPEVINHYYKVTSAQWNPVEAQVWSLGTVAFILLTGGPAYVDPIKQPAHFHYVQSGMWLENPRPQWKDKDKNLLSLVDSMLKIKDRITFAKLYETVKEW